MKQTPLWAVTGKHIPLHGWVQEGKGPRNILSDTITFVVYDKDTLEVALTKSSTTGAITRAANGAYTVLIDPTDLDDATGPQYYYEVELKRADNNYEIPLNSGPFEIIRTPL